MKLRTGLRSLIGLSVVGIVIAVFLIYTCPFAGQVSFSALVRQVPHAEAHAEGQKEHGGKGEKHEGVKTRSEAAEKPHDTGASEAHQRKNGLSVHFMVVPDVRQYPAKETKVFGIDVNPIGIVVLLVLTGLCFQILRQRPFSLFGWTLTPKAAGIAVLAITFWNLFFAAFLLGIEIFQFREL